MRLGAIFFALTLLMMQVVYGARVSGIVWDSKIEPAEGVAVEVNTTPMQRDVTGPDGSYFFELEPGDYEIVVKKVEKHQLEQVASEKVRIERDGNYTLDIMLIGPDIDILDFPDDSEFEIQSTQKDERKEPPYAVIAIFFLIFIAIVYLLVRMKPTADEKGAKEPEIKPEEGKLPISHEKKSAKLERVIPEETTSAQERKEKLPEDLLEIVDIIKANDGRITQKDLRKEIPLSEAKVSLMITELEDLGILKKIKKGRGNILILKEKQL